MQGAAPSKIKEVLERPAFGRGNIEVTGQNARTVQELRKPPEDNSKKRTVAGTVVWFAGVNPVDRGNKDSAAFL